MMRLLLVEDDQNEALVIKNLLKEGLSNQFTLEQSPSVSRALDLIQQYSFQAIILDLDLPDGKSFESIPQFIQYSPGAPILILSGVEDEDRAIQAVKSGAQDYLIKGQTSSSTLCRAIRYAMERHRATQRITQLAHYDHLTGLANRGLFYERLNCAVARCHRNDMAMALMFLDLDHFKEINFGFIALCIEIMGFSAYAFGKFHHFLYAEVTVVFFRGTNGKVAEVRKDADIFHIDFPHDAGEPFSV